MEALAAMALPHVLQAAYSALTMAWAQYESVKEQKAQCKALLRRCTDLILGVAKKSGLRSNDPMLVHVRSLDKCVFVITYDTSSHACNAGLALPLRTRSQHCHRTVLRGDSYIRVTSERPFHQQKGPYKLLAKRLMQVPSPNAYFSENKCSFCR
jgi:hypothetical protein